MPPPMKLLLDTNMILNAIFVPSSWALLVVNEAVKHDWEIFIGTNCFKEAMGIIDNKSKKSIDSFSTIDYFVRFF